jgi:hypothetical protein
MSTSASTQAVLTVVKDEFTQVLTEGTLSPTTKPADWNVVITLLDAMKTLSPPPEELRRGLVTLYNTTFLTLKSTMNLLSTVLSYGAIQWNINSSTLFMLIIKTTSTLSENYVNMLWRYWRRQIELTTGI